jgi:nucleotide-binding universal stress UspA family protein
MNNPVLVVADDGSPGADAVWLWLAEQRWPGWSVKVVTVADALPATAGPVTADGLHEWMPPHPRPALPGAELAEVQHLVGVGDPRAVLSSVDGTALAVGPRGHGRLRALTLGSTTEHLLHTMPRPLFVIRHPRPIKRVVACADGSESATAAIELLASMPWLATCEVTVVTVVGPDRDPQRALAAAVAQLQSAAGSVHPVVLKPDSDQVFYHVRDLIFDELRAREADLVVHGSRGLSELRGLQVGAIASSLARHAPCSALVVGRPAGSANRG